VEWLGAGWELGGCCTSFLCCCELHVSCEIYLFVLAGSFFFSAKRIEISPGKIDHERKEERRKREKVTTAS
jgi:hypothetical protein